MFFRLLFCLSENDSGCMVEMQAGFQDIELSLLHVLKLDGLETLFTPFKRGENESCKSLIGAASDQEQRSGLPSTGTSFVTVWRPVLL
jgi:hypothetical protein